MLPITPERLGTVYEMLRGWPPFCQWHLPSSSEVTFHVTRTRSPHAAWWIDGDRHHIQLSERTHSHLPSIIMSMGHEIIHVRQRIAKTETRGVEHNAEFYKLSKRICRIHGFDYGQFVG
jgi:hypothetical protein